jgi:uracil-DNA glycosylase
MIVGHNFGNANYREEIDKESRELLLDQVRLFEPRVILLLGVRYLNERYKPSHPGGKIHVIDL